MGIDGIAVVPDPARGIDKAAAAPGSNTDVKSLNRSGGLDSNNNSADFTLNAAITPTPAGGSADPVDPDPVDPPAAPTARTTSYSPEATASAAFRTASMPVAQ